MPLFALGLTVILVVGAMAFLKLWVEVAQLRTELQQVRGAQDTLMDMVSTKLLEDDALSREFLKLKATRARSTDE